MLLASLTSFVLNMVLIRQRYLEGAAMAMLITECIVLAGSIWLSKDIFKADRFIQKQCLGALLIIPVTWLAAFLVKHSLEDPIAILCCGIGMSIGLYLLIQLLLLRNVFFVELLGKIRGLMKGEW